MSHVPHMEGTNYLCVCVRARACVKESLGLYELKQHKPWFDEECVCFLDHRKQAEMHGLQNPNQSNVGNVNNVDVKLVDILGTK